MVGMTGFVKRCFCLAAVALFLFTVGVVAESPYVIISAGGSTSRFSVIKNGDTLKLAQNVELDSAVRSISNDAHGEAVTIQFGADGDSLDIGVSTVDIDLQAGSGQRWGDVTLTGKLKKSGSAGAGLVRVNGSGDTTEFKVRNKANMDVSKGGYAFLVGGNVSLTLDACTLSTVNGNVIISDDGKNNKLVVLGGKYTSVSGNVLLFSGYVEIEDGWFESESGAAVYSSSAVIKKGTFKSVSKYAVCSWQRLTIYGGTFSSSIGTVIFVYREAQISGGRFFTLGDQSVLEAFIGANVVISDSAEFVSQSQEGATIEIKYGSVAFNGGKVINEFDGRAVYISKASGKLILSGQTPTQVKGRIASKFAGAISVDSSFKPYKAGYNLEPLGVACRDGAVAVRGGASFHESFSISNNQMYVLDTVDDNIVVILKDGVRVPKYMIVGDTAKGFVAVLDSAGFRDTIGTGSMFRDAIGIIKLDANARPCSILVGRPGVGLNIGNSSIYITEREGPKWGRITLLGKVTTRRNNNVHGPTYAVNLSNGVSLESSLDIVSFDHEGDVIVGAGSDFTYRGTGETVCNRILNEGGAVRIVSGAVSHIDNNKDGSLEIVGGRVGGVKRYKYAVKNDTLAQVIISDLAEIVSADTSADGGTIVNSGILKIYGGSVSNVGRSKSGMSIAINNDYNGSDTTIHPTVEISGSTEIFSKSADTNGVIYNRKGEMTISDGQIYNTTDTVGSVVVNYGKLTISGSAEIYSGGRYNSGAIVGTVYSMSDKEYAGEAALEIFGGKIAAADGYAVSVNGAGGAAIYGSTKTAGIPPTCLDLFDNSVAKITTESPNGAIYIGPNSYLNLYGGRVSSTAEENDSTRVVAIDVSEDGKGGGPGRLVMGGSPKVCGIILLGMLDSIPIEIKADSGHIFDPDGEIYRIVGRVSNGRVVLKNGVNVFRSFLLDTAGNAGLKLAVNGNDAVAAEETCNVEFDLNGANTMESPPPTIPVIAGGTIGDKAKPSTINYMLTRGMYIITNDEKWYIYNGMVGDVVEIGLPFDFGVGDNGTKVTEKIKLILNWKGDSTWVSVLESSRDLPSVRPSESAAISPVVSSSGALTAGPSPVAISAGGAVNFFRGGAALKEGKLFIYDAAGNVVTKIIVNDNHGAVGRRSVAKWDLRDANGRQAAEGTYVARGVVTAKTGKKERVSLLINVQR
jgi:hypothetical protein